MADPAPDQKCARCGAPFICGMKAGIEPCWCASYPPVDPDGQHASCLCPTCLAARAAQDAPDGSPAPG